jgi:hypothetical protein
MIGNGFCSHGRNEEMYERVMGDIEDYLRTPPGHPDFLEKYQAIAVNSRQIMDAGCPVQ